MCQAAGVPASSPACWLIDDVAASLAERVYVEVFSEAKRPLSVCVPRRGELCDLEDIRGRTGAVSSPWDDRCLREGWEVLGGLGRAWGPLI